MNEQSSMEFRIALTSLSMALTDCKTQEDRDAAREILFESTNGIIALEQLEHVLGLAIVELEDVVRSFELGPMTIELLRSSAFSDETVTTG